MVQAYYNSALRFLSPGCLTGPIFGKELRVSSRRRRNYLLRAAYLAMLIVFLVLFWLAEVPRGSSGLSRVSRMAEAGKNITAFIIWFQFIATQMVAAVMLCTAISDEIRHRTLGLLMTTPINSFQVVIGKLASKLLQLLLLLAISLPLLAIVRVFGGVPWMFVVSSLCITLTALVFVGSLSLFFSMLCSRAYVVLILVAITYGGLFFLLPWLSGWLCHVLTGRWPGPRLTTAIFYADPPVALMFNTELLSRGRTPGGFAMMSWPVHCAILLAVSGLILAVCIRVVRRIALRQAVGGSGPSSPPGTADVPATAESGPVRPVTGPPVLWKELRSPMITRRKKVVLGLALLVLFVTYALCAAEDILDHVDTHMMDVVVFGGIGMLFTIIRHRDALYYHSAGYIHHLGEGIPVLAPAAYDRSGRLGDSLRQVRRGSEALPARMVVAVRPRNTLLPRWYNPSGRYRPDGADRRRAGGITHIDRALFQRALQAYDRCGDRESRSGRGDLGPRTHRNGPADGNRPGGPGFASGLSGDESRRPGPCRHRGRRLRERLVLLAGAALDCRSIAGIGAGLHVRLHRRRSGFCLARKVPA